MGRLMYTAVAITCISTLCLSDACDDKSAQQVLNDKANGPLPGYCSDNLTLSGGRCWGDGTHVNESIVCTGRGNNGLEGDNSVLSWCSRDKAGNPSCASRFNRTILNCRDTADNYERCKCGYDERGRTYCACEKMLFWKIYPFIYMVMGLAMLTTLLGCHFMRVCKNQDSDDEEVDVEKINQYMKSSAASNRELNM